MISVELSNSSPNDIRTDLPIAVGQNPCVCRKIASDNLARGVKGMSVRSFIDQMKHSIASSIIDRFVLFASCLYPEPLRGGESCDAWSP